MLRRPPMQKIRAMARALSYLTLHPGLLLTVDISHPGGASPPSSSYIIAAAAAAAAAAAVAAAAARTSGRGSDRSEASKFEPGLALALGCTASELMQDATGGPPSILTAPLNQESLITTLPARACGTP
jgi:hypothetical protein